ncbi:hypothetical protein WME95_05995 [Sorangium sp. So ce327]|jgi:hypothetical protein|uniref:hypothetical protein n=1 Tax=Sorangium sp. So ce327 TaxID=3133301 RepID=UPI003F64250B
MLSMPVRSLLLATLALALLSLGCATGTVVARYYQGPIRPPAEVAVVTFAPQVYVSTLDGHWLGEGSFMETLPGTHKLRIALFDRMQNVTLSSGIYETEVSVVAGCQYRLGFNQLGEGAPTGFSWEPTFTEIDNPSAVDDWLSARSSGFATQ